MSIEWCKGLQNNCLVKACEDWDRREGRCPAITEEERQKLNKHLGDKRKMRSGAYENWIGRPPREVLKSPPPALVEAQCLSSICPSRGVSYMAYDLRAFVQKELAYMNGKEPVIGPCPACNDYTNEVVKNQIPKGGGK